MSSRSTLAQAYFDLATMLDAGMPILRSLDVVIEGRQGYLKLIFTQIRKIVSDGANLAEALAQYPKIFPEMDCMLIEAAETSGSLPFSLNILSQWHEFVHRITCQMLSAMTYPILILHLGAFIAAVPGALLGGFTLSGFLWSVLQPLLLLYIPASIVLAMIFLQKRAPVLRWPLDLIALRIPILGRAIYHLSICRYTKAFNMLYSAGVPITETTERAIRVTGNVVVGHLFQGSIASVRTGGMAWEGFSKRLPTEYLQLWQIGEESGELDKTTSKVAEISGNRADLYFTEFSRWLPRILYLAIMLFLAIKIILLFQRVYGGVISDFSF